MEQARKVSAAAQAEALRNGLRMVVAIMDSGGHSVLLERMDNAQASLQDPEGYYRVAEVEVSAAKLKR